MEVGEVPKRIRWSAEAGGPPKVRIGGVSGRGRGPTIKTSSVGTHFVRIWCLSPRSQVRGEPWMWGRSRRGKGGRPRPGIHQKSEYVGSAAEVGVPQ